MTYNFLGGGSAARDAWKMIGRLKPDILLAQECRCPPAGTSRQILWAEAVAGRWGTGVFLAVATMAVQRKDGFCGAFVPDGAARAAAGEREGHAPIIIAALQPFFMIGCGEPGAAPASPARDADDETNPDPAADDHPIRRK